MGTDYGDVLMNKRSVGFSSFCVAALAAAFVVAVVGCSQQSDSIQGDKQCACAKAEGGKPCPHCQKAEGGKPCDKPCEKPCPHHKAKGQKPSEEPGNVKDAEGGKPCAKPCDKPCEKPCPHAKAEGQKPGKKPVSLKDAEAGKPCPRHKVEVN